VVVLTSALAALAQRLGLDEVSPSFQRALTHSSYASEHAEASNERMEFLGDAVVNLAIADAILRDYPELDEGTGSLARSRVVNEPTLARVAESLGVPEVMRLGNGERKSGGATRPSLLADAFEALIAATYFDCGAERAIAVAQELLRDELANAVLSPHSADPKSQLRHWAEVGGRGLPTYEVVGSGPDHDPTFTAVVMIDGVVRGTATGRSKKVAEASAALIAWEGRDNA